MTHKVTLQPSGHCFEVSEGKSILAAGLEAGFAMPYSCRSGVCRTCRGKVRSGTVDFGMVHPNYLTEAHKAEGWALLCQATPLSDLVIEVKEAEAGAVKPRIVPCRVLKITKPAPDVAILNLRLPMNENMMFSAGQYVELLLKDGIRRAYSIASAPSAEGVVEIDLHIRHTPGGVFTDHVFGAMKERELLRFEGPLGSFYLREETNKPIVIVASGTGFAPIKSICEYAFRKNIGAARPMTLYWGCRTKADLYMLDLPTQWASAQPGFRFVPVLSEPTPACAWSGRTGFVHRAVMEDFADLSGCEAYVCGAPIVVESARRDFMTQCKLPEEAFFADSFLTEAERANPVIV